MSDIGETTSEQLLRENEELKRKIVSLEARSKLVVKKDSRIEQSKERKLVADFAIGINRNKTRDEIISELGISSSDFDRLHTKYYKQIEREQDGKSPLRIFSEYVSLQNELVRTLWEFVEHSKKNKYKNAQAFVAGVRAQSEILDKIISKGQDLGVIVKTPDRVLIVDGHDTRDMDSAELRHHTMRMLEEIRGKVVDAKQSKAKRGKLVQFKSVKAQQEGNVS